jgi:RND family efflux transporter MFP subunit
MSLRIRLLPAPVRAWLSGRPRLRRAAAGGTILLGGLTVAGALVATTPQPPAEEPEEKAWPVSVQVVEPAERSPVLSVFGRIEAAATTDLEAPLSAPVADVLVREGQRVATGDVLVRLDDAEARFAVTEAEAELASIRGAADLARRTAGDHETVAGITAARLARFESLFERGMIARADLDAVRREASEARIALERQRTELADFPHRVARAEVALERARLDLSRTAIRAPFPGPVVAVHVARGDQVGPGSPLVSLVDATSMELRVPVPAREIGRLRARDDAVVAHTTIAGRELALPLARLAGDQKDGRTVVDAFFALPADAEAPAGQVADVRLALPAETDVVAVPVQALYENERVYRIEDGRLVGMDAEVIGETERGGDYRVLVRVPGLEAGARVITTQLPRAITGLKVAPVGERLASRPANGGDEDAG